MKSIYQSIRLKTLDSIPGKLAPLRDISAPAQGWLRIVREALGLPLRAIAEKLHVSAQTIHAFERREAAGTLTLANLRKVADALHCEVVYFIVPKDPKVETFTALAATQSGFLEHLLASEHSMQLEDQGVGNINDRLESAARQGDLA